MSRLQITEAIRRLYTDASKKTCCTSVLRPVDGKNCVLPSNTRFMTMTEEQDSGDH